MAASVTTSSTASTQVESIEAKFRRLVVAWERATAHLSSMSAASEHPAYQEIIALGAAVVPFLLRDLQEKERHWFIALGKITGACPVPETAAGNMPKMIEAWLLWAKENDYRW